MRPHVPRHTMRRLVGTLSLLTVAVTPAAPGPPRIAADDPSFGASVTAAPAETALGQFARFTVSAANMPVGPATVRLRGIAAATVQVAPAGPGSTIGGFGPIDVAVPPGAAACGQDPVTVDGVSTSAVVNVYCPVLTVTPNPVFSGGTATELEITASGFPHSRGIGIALDGQNRTSMTSGGDGTVSGTVDAGALACGDHQLTATVLPESPPKLRVAATVYPPPVVFATVSVLGCASSSPPPQIFANPVETGIDQFTRFSVDGVNLAAGPATVKLAGVTAGTVVVASDGTFPTTDFTVPAGAAACGRDEVTIDDLTAAVASTSIAVFCPVLTVTPDPVFSAGDPADLTLSGTGYPGNRAIDFTVDGQEVGATTTAADGSVAEPVHAIALACGTHAVVGTARPQPPVEIGAGPRAAHAVVPIDPPIPASTRVTVLGCASSPTPPVLTAHPAEVALAQFSRFTVDGSLLPTGPATIRLQGIAAGTARVDANGILPTTRFDVPAGAARCGRDPVTLDHGGTVAATAIVAVFCPTLTVTPDPVDSGGAAAVLDLTGTGFPPNRAVDLGFDGTDRTTVTSDGNGSVRGTLRGVVPACGAHQVAATARPPATATPATLGDFPPIGATAPVTVVGCARIVADPDVLQQGMLTHVTGTGFLPRSPVTVTWRSLDGAFTGACAPDAISEPALRTDPAGRIDVFCLALPHQAVGSLRITAEQPPETETAPVVVEDGSMQPSHGDEDQDANQFVFRR